MQRKTTASIAAMVLASSFTFAAPARANELFGEPLTGDDKALHFGTSAAISVVVYGASTGVVVEPWQRATIAASVAAAAGLAKEGVDLLGFGTPSLVDLCYDGFGIMVGVGYALALDAVTGAWVAGVADE
jgi:hypothetical protein